MREYRTNLLPRETLQHRRRSTGNKFRFLDCVHVHSTSYFTVLNTSSRSF